MVSSPYSALEESQSAAECDHAALLRRQACHGQIQPTARGLSAPLIRKMPERVTQWQRPEREYYHHAQLLMEVFRVTLQASSFMY